MPGFGYPAIGQPTHLVEFSRPWASRGYCPGETAGFTKETHDWLIEKGFGSSRGSVVNKKTPVEVDGERGYEIKSLPISGHSTKK